MVRRIADPLIAHPLKVFIGIGGSEGGQSDHSAFFVGLTRRLEANFRASGYDDSNLKVVVDADAIHTEAAWAKRLPGALTFLFGDWKAVSPPGASPQ